ncbi:hypothetical protein E2C01_009034 [Portunus trituberculatus]|uniref:Uncharacterized protein n=1 Tax=Portunus trituberculatus TaxID=210409 RepID=A0A5B7D547_PORTR|nr:hypothetical protein [Portunus trituberculatus]
METRHGTQGVKKDAEWHSPNRKIKKTKYRNSIKRSGSVAEEDAVSLNDTVMDGAHAVMSRSFVAQKRKKGEEEVTSRPPPTLTKTKTKAIFQGKEETKECIFVL